MTSDAILPLIRLYCSVALSHSLCSAATHNQYVCPFAQWPRTLWDTARALTVNIRWTPTPVSASASALHSASLHCNHTALHCTPRECTRVSPPFARLHELLRVESSLAVDERTRGLSLPLPLPLSCADVLARFVAFVNETVAVADYLRWKTFILMGHSFGSVSAYVML